MGLVVRLRWPFLPACRGKGLYRSKIHVSWKPSPSPTGEKGNFETDYMPKRIFETDYMQKRIVPTEIMCQSMLRA